MKKTLLFLGVLLCSCAAQDGPDPVGRSLSDPCTGLDAKSCAFDPRCTQGDQGCEPLPDVCPGLDAKACSETHGCGPVLDEQHLTFQACAALGPDCNISAVETYVGMWGQGGHIYIFAIDGSFSLTDDPTECEAGLPCVRKEVVTNHGTWRVSSPGVIELVYDKPVHVLQGAVLSKKLELMTCGFLMVETETGREISPALDWM